MWAVRGCGSGDWFDRTRASRHRLPSKGQSQTRANGRARGRRMTMAIGADPARPGPLGFAGRGAVGSAPARSADLRVRPEEPQPALKQERLAVDQPEEATQAGLGRWRLEQRLAPRRFDLEDAGEEVREHGRIVRD